jgi:hypothetical protein
MKQDLKIEGHIGLNEYKKEEKESLRKPKAKSGAGQYSVEVYNHKEGDSDEE